MIDAAPRDGGHALDAADQDAGHIDGSDGMPRDAAGPRDAGVADAATDTAMGDCSVLFLEGRVVCEMSGGGPLVRADVAVEFAGCGCSRAVLTMQASTGPRWTISKTLVADVARFDASDPWYLGSATTDVGYSLDVYCDADGGLPLVSASGFPVPVAEPCP